MRTPTIAVIGGGPRGVSLLERIAANLPDPCPPVEVVLIDDTQPGAGRVWRTDQPREMCMNTLAHAVTLFTDRSVTMAGPVVEGPTLHEWCLLALGRGDTVPEAHAAAVRAVPPRAGLVAEFGDELRAQRPESHPSRALYGEYISWTLAWVRTRLPAAVRLRIVRDRVVRAAGDALHLAGRSEPVRADAIVAATGWMDNADDASEEALAASGLLWIRPGSPIDQGIERVPDGSSAIVRGLGMGFFDAMALLTVERGGRFAEGPDGLRYEASGREPVLHVTSRRGVPFRAKSLYGGLPPAAPLRRLRAVRWGRPADADAVLWPLARRDAAEAYVETFARLRPGAVDVAGARRAIDDDAPLEPFFADPADAPDIDALAFPGRGGAWTDPDAFGAWVRGFVAHDLAEAERGADSPEKAALWALSQARGIASRVGAFGGFDADSRERGLRTVFSVGAMAGSGPPAFRSRQLLALMDAGLVRFIGPAAHVRPDGDLFRAHSDAVPGSDVSAPVLIDAWMHVHDAGRTADPLIASLVGAGRLRGFRVAARDGSLRATGGIDVDPATGRLVRVDGSLDPTFHAAGIPLDQTMHDALISPMPGADATMLRETDRVARSLLRTAGIG